MKKLSFVISFLVLLSAFALAREISLDGGSVTFQAPDGFSELSQREIDLKFPRANPPEHVVGGEGRRTTIAYQLRPQAVRPVDLPAVQKVMTQALDQAIKGIQWKQNEVVEMAGHPWLLMEMTSQAIDQDIHNILLVTSHKGKMLMFNFNSTKKEFPKVEDMLRKSIESIVLKRE